MKRIIREVARAYNEVSSYPVTEAEINGKNRKQYITEARQVCIYFMRITTKLSTTEIGHAVNRDHATVTHSIKVVRDRFARGQLLINDFDSLYCELTTQKDSKVTRKQQEILYINKKVVSIEAGSIVNAYDFTFDELDSIGRFLKTSIL